MSANITCGKCEAPLKDSSLKLDNGQKGSNLRVS
ncbi:hypothetical protein EMGBS14_05320 [Candidatus Pelagibacterales bacterium]|nr:hypothetical protein EMGBS14_05320 [Pelagibacterales bacterium]